MKDEAQELINESLECMNEFVNSTGETASAAWERLHEMRHKIRNYRINDIRKYMTERTDEGIEFLKNVVGVMHDVYIFSKIPESLYSGYEGEYDNIRLPKRATKGSAGYDFFSNEDVIIKPGESHVFRTGICVAMNTRGVLLIMPRSGLGFKYRCGLANTVGVIDSDYLFSDNGGHIMIKLVNDGDEEIHITKGQAFAQGIFMNYITTIDDDVIETRNGGFGSTSSNQEE